MSFPQFPNGTVNHEITLHKKGESEYEYDLNIGWQLIQQNHTKINSGISVSKLCLGAVKCNMEKCGKLVRPASSMKRITSQIAEPCTFCNHCSLEHVTCSVKVNFKIIGNISKCTHKGTHMHDTFEPLHDTMEVLDKVEERVLECPSETAYALKVGTSVIRPQVPARPISMISKTVQRHGKIKCYCCNYLTKAGELSSTRPSLERSVEELQELKNDFPRYLQSVNIMSSEFCITFSVPAVAACVDFNKHPILTDVTYDCFTKGYYLCSTNIFFDELDKFGVVFQAVLDGLTTDHFKAYFLAFFRTFAFAIGRLDEDIDINFSGLIMDYSQAQRQGFILGFKKHFPKQSVQRLVSNHSIVPHGSDTEFLDLTSTMYNAKSEKTFERAVQQLHDNFPNCARWLKWWTRDQVASMIFRSKDALKKELQEANTRTTNGIEAFHRDLYRIVQRKKSIMVTLRNIFCYLRSIEADFESFDDAFKVKDSRKQSSKLRTIRFINDGRAPDTTKALLGSAQEKQKDKAGIDLPKKEDKDEKGSRSLKNNKGEKDGEEEKKGTKDKRIHVEEESKARRERLANLREEQTKKVREEYKKNKQKRKQESEEREAKRLKSLDQSTRYNFLFKKLHLSSIPEFILQQYNFNKEDFVGRFCLEDDGNCGWRAASLMIFNNEKHYYMLKKVMRSGLEKEQTFFKQLFGVRDYEKLRTKLYQPEGSVNSINWFDSIDCAVLLAMVCKRPVIILAGIQSNTYLPFEERSSVIHTGQVQDVTPIVLYLHLNHFYAFIVKEESVDNIKWPRICPTYKNEVIDYNRSTVWLDIYKGRCHATREDGM
ncbi:hypothetical protein INT45_006780 [Circinella minor]|uniref:OTU domain-containing protein n=1 Tax=Circinella minor TaxID=1195481 RepID=A0A8H7S7T2_9FUNG|nr:hypothetical protein INT45_006780 [Circinella minor]